MVRPFPRWQLPPLLVLITVDIGHRWRRLGPLQPLLPDGSGPSAGVKIVVVVFDLGIEPTDELAPVKAVAQVGRRTVGEVR